MTTDDPTTPASPGTGLRPTDAIPAGPMFRVVPVDPEPGPSADALSAVADLMALRGAATRVVRRLNEVVVDAYDHGDPDRVREYLLLAAELAPALARVSALIGSRPRPTSAWIAPGPTPLAGNRWS